MQPTKPTQLSVGNPRPRARGRTAPDLADIAHRITDRDITVADWLDRHGVLTTGQLAAAFWRSPITASHRLHQLRQLGWIDRFRRYRAGGSSTACWVIGPLGARWCAAARGDNPPAAAELRRRRDRWAASPHLAHRLGAHSFFIDLHAAGGLQRWWSDAESTARFARRIRPDGTGRFRDTWFFLEYDTGTEVLQRLVRKLDAYTQLRIDGGPGWPVLFYLPGRDRERHLHAALDQVRVAVPVATAVHADPPHEAVWQLTTTRPRFRLAELPSQPPTGPMYGGDLG